jgi:hypothetical protein
MMIMVETRIGMVIMMTTTREGMIDMITLETGQTAEEIGTHGIASGQRKIGTGEEMIGTVIRLREVMVAEVLIISMIVVACHLNAILA